MKQLLFLFTLLLFSFNVIAQKCETTNDPFTNKKVTVSKKIIELKSELGRSVGNEFKMTNENDENYYLEINYNSNRVMVESIAENENISMKLEDGTILIYTIDKEIIPSRLLNGNEYTSWYRIKIKTSKEDLQKISNSSVSFLRIKIDKNYDLTPHKMQTNAISKMASCMLNK